MKRSEKSDRQGYSGRSDRPRYGLAFGNALQDRFDHPPYQSDHLQGSSVWTPILFAWATGFTDSAVRQWLRGVVLPINNFSTIVRELYGPDPEEHTEDIGKLRAVLRACERLRAGGSSEPEIEPVQTVPSVATSAFEPIPSAARLIGRYDELEMLVAAFAGADYPAVLVQGGPGVGKTELTKAVAHHMAVATRFGDRRWFIRLEAASSAEAMKDAVVRAIGCDPRDGFDAALAALRDQPTLLILDNLETPWGPLGERQATLEVLAAISAVPGVALLASIRGTQHIAAPHWSYELCLREFPHDPAAELFAAISGEWVRADPHFEDFLTALGGLPLAITLVAHRAHGRASLSALWQRWQEIRSDLAALPEYERDRLTSLPHSIELSLDSSRMRGHPALRLFGILGQLPGGLGLGDCEVLLGDSAFEAHERICHVGLGIEQNDRLSLLPPIREHATRHRPPDDGDLAACVAYFSAMIGRLAGAVSSGSDSTAIEKFSHEIRNIEQSLETRLASGGLAAVMSRVPDFSWLAVLSASSSSLFQKIGDLCLAEQDYIGHADCIKANGDIALRRSDYPKALAFFERAAIVYRESQSTLGEANCLRNIAEIQLIRTDLRGAEATLDEVLATYRRVGDDRGVANTLKGLANVQYARGDFKNAALNLRESHDVYGRLGDNIGRANCLKTMGQIASLGEDFASAASLFRDSKQIYRSAGDKLGEANCLKAIGDIHLQSSSFEEAIREFEAAEKMYKEALDDLGQANCLFKIGDVYFRQGEVGRAESFYERSDEVYRITGNFLGLANIEQRRGDISADRNENACAITHYREAGRMYDKIGQDMGASDCMLKAEALERYAS